MRLLIEFIGQPEQALSVEIPTGVDVPDVPDIPWLKRLIDMHPDVALVDYEQILYARVLR